MDDCTLTNLEPSVVILLHNSTLNCLLDFIAKLMDDVGEKVMYSRYMAQGFFERTKQLQSQLLLGTHFIILFF